MKINLLNKKESAEYLGISIRTIFRMVDAGKINEYFAGKRKVGMISPLDLDKLKK